MKVGWWRLVVVIAVIGWWWLRVIVDGWVVRGWTHEQREKDEGRKEGREWRYRCRRVCVFFIY